MGRGRAGSGWGRSHLAFHSYSIGVDLVIQFHTKIHKLRQILWFFGLVNESGLEFLGKTRFEGSLLCITVII
jgi:hypothetical protein